MDETKENKIFLEYEHENKTVKIPVEFKKPTMNLIDDLLALRHEFLVKAKKIDSEYPELMKIAGQEIPIDRPDLNLQQDELNAKATQLTNIYAVLQFQMIIKWDNIPEEVRDADAMKWDYKSDFWSEQDLAMIKREVDFFRSEIGI